MLLHQKLKTKRLELELGAKELSIRAQLDPSLVTRFEKGERIPTEVQIERLAQALFIDPLELRKTWLSTQIEKLLSKEEIDIKNEVLRSLLGEVQEPKSTPDTDEISERISKLEISFNRSKKLHPSEWSAAKFKQLSLYLNQLSPYFEYSFTEKEIISILIQGKTITNKGLKEHLVLHGLYQIIEKFAKGNKSCFSSLSDILNSDIQVNQVYDLDKELKGEWKINESLLTNTIRIIKILQNSPADNWLKLMMLNLNFYKFSYPVISLDSNDPLDQAFVFRAIKKRLAQSLDDIES